MKHLAKALAAAQQDFDPVVKDASNPFFKSHYATLASYLHATQGALAKNGLAVTQPLVLHEGQLCVKTILMHESGDHIESICPVISQKQDPQSLGGAITYFRRYAYAAILSVAQVDDDGESASDRNAPPAPQPKPVTPPPTVGYRGTDADKKMLFEWLKGQKLPPDAELRTVATQLHDELLASGKKISEALPLLKKILESK